jgi:hypothetical protein
MTARPSSPLRRTVPSVAAIGIACCSAAFALQEGTTPAGRRYASGGVSDAEQATLQARRGQYSLWIATAARKSGAWMSDVQVTIIDAQDRVVFNGTLDGPWLLLDLPLGRYDVVARSGGQMQRSVTTIHPGDHHETVIYFEVDADVLPPAAKP